MKDLNKIQGENIKRFREGEKYIYGKEGNSESGIFLISLDDTTYYVIANSNKYVDKLIISSRKVEPSALILKEISKIFLENEKAEHIKIETKNKNRKIKAVICNKSSMLSYK